MNDLLHDEAQSPIAGAEIRLPTDDLKEDLPFFTKRLGFRLIFCIHGWVRLVYEDQGPPFILGAGDCVIQPPEIRHRVLESGNDLQVIEVGVPAEHVTTIDHQMELPNDTYDPQRSFGGQKFVHHKVAEADWTPWRIPGFVQRETGICEGTDGAAEYMWPGLTEPGSRPRRTIPRISI